MEAIVWLKIGRSSRWPRYKAVAFVTKPNTDAGEVAIKLNLEIPDEVFREPVYETKVVIPKPAKKLPELAEVSEKLAKALSAEMGFKVRVEIPDQQKAVL